MKHLRFGSDSFIQYQSCGFAAYGRNDFGRASGAKRNAIQPRFQVVFNRRNCLCPSIFCFICSQHVVNGIRQMLCQRPHSREAIAAGESRSDKEHWRFTKSVLYFGKELVR